MKAIRIRPESVPNPSQSVPNPSRICPEYGESGTNPAQASVTDSRGQKDAENLMNIKKNTLSLYIYESGTPPPAHAINVRVRAHARGVCRIRVPDSPERRNAMPARCDHCRFFHPNPPGFNPMVSTPMGIPAGGECRRRPPVWHTRVMACFPVVSNDCWCGDFEPKPPVHPLAVAIPERGI